MIPKKGRYYKCNKAINDGGAIVFEADNIYLSKKDNSLVGEGAFQKVVCTDEDYWQDFEEVTPDVVDTYRRHGKAHEGLVSHPLHYNSHPSGIECIEIARHYCFSIGNAIKYLWRAGLKQEIGKSDVTKEIEDLKKAKWYIDDRIKQLKADDRDYQQNGGTLSVNPQ
jgi:hypothetical protein